MATCASTTVLFAGGDTVRTSPGGANANVLVLAPSADVSACPYLFISGAEYLALKNSSGSSGADGGGACTNPFSMSAEDGGLLSAAIVGCWAAAYFVRSVINVVKNGVES